MNSQRTQRTGEMTSRAKRVVDDRSARTAVAAKLNQLIAARGLNQAEAGQMLGMPQPKISAIRNLKLRGISLERLLQALAALDQHVNILVEPSCPGLPAGIRVDAQRRSRRTSLRSVKLE